MSNIVFSLFERTKIHSKQYNSFEIKRERLVIENERIELKTEDYLEFLKDYRGRWNVLRIPISETQTKCFLLPCGLHKKIKDSGEEFQEFDCYVKLITSNHAINEMRVNEMITKEFIESGKTPHFAQTFACFSQKNNFNLEKLIGDNTGFFRKYGSSDSKTIYCIVSERSRMGCLNDIMYQNIVLRDSIAENCNSIMFQLLFTFYQLHRMNKVHGDVHSKNILLKQSHCDWNVYYSIKRDDDNDNQNNNDGLYENATNDNQNSNSSNTIMVFRPIGNRKTGYIAKIIDFDTMHNSGKPLSRPLTMIHNRPPEQIVCCMKNQTQPELMYKSTTKSDIFSLGIVFVEMLILFYGQRNIFLLQSDDIFDTSDLQSISEWNEINRIIEEFKPKILQNHNQPQVYTTQYIVGQREEHFFWKYIRNLVYLLGPPEFEDLFWFKNEYSQHVALWTDFFQKFKQAQLKPHLIEVMKKKFNIPGNYIWLCSNMIRWNAKERFSAKQLIFEYNRDDGKYSSFFQMFLGRKQSYDSIDQFVDENKEYLESKTFCVWGDTPLSQRREYSQQQHSTSLMHPMGSKRHQQSYNTLQRYPNDNRQQTYNGRTLKYYGNNPVPTGPPSSSFTSSSSTTTLLQSSQNREKLSSSTHHTFDVSNEQQTRKKNDKKRKESEKSSHRINRGCNNNDQQIVQKQTRRKVVVAK